MKRALIFHGTHGTPQANWFPWLSDHLMMEGWQVAVPKFSTPEGQSLESWTAALQEQVPGFQDVEVVIGHSLGATFILRLIEQKLIEPKQVILVSAVIDKINNEEYDALNKSFTDPEFDWKTINLNQADVTIIHGNDDPYVPLEQPKEIADHLDIPLNLIQDAGHINADSDYTDFPEILDFIDE